MVLECGAKQATKYLSEKLVLKATRHGKVNARDRVVVAVVTAGPPNYRERKFIKAHQAAGHSLPIAGVKTKFPPPKKHRAKNAKPRH